MSKRRTNTTSRKNKRRGGRLRKVKKATFNRIINGAKNAIVQSDPLNSALQGARATLKKLGGKRNIKIPRTIPIPTKIGGFIGLVPLFAGLSALGSLVGSAAKVTQVVNKASKARNELAEMKRHNGIMESVAIGRGMFMKPYKNGYALTLKTGLKKKKNFQ